MDPRAAVFPNSSHARLATLPGVEVASPALELEVALAGRRGSLRVLGVDPFRAGLIQPALFAELAGNFFGLFARDGIFLSSAAAAELGVAKGDRFDILVGTQPRSLRVLGLLAPEAYPQRLGIMDIASAQWTLDRLGVLNRIDLRLAAARSQRSSGRNSHRSFRPVCSPWRWRTSASARCRSPVPIA
ncbi:MAG: hypothetical protein IPO58_24500 [Betaproteobacteria bacterium]|nr:hypothetical protein [Betaproteobacteria bacterium]